MNYRDEQCQTPTRRKRTERAAPVPDADRCRATTIATRVQRFPIKWLIRAVVKEQRDGGRTMVITSRWMKDDKRGWTGPAKIGGSRRGGEFFFFFK